MQVVLFDFACFHLLCYSIVLVRERSMRSPFARARSRAPCHQTGPRPHTRGCLLSPIIFEPDSC